MTSPVRGAGSISSASDRVAKPECASIAVCTASCKGHANQLIHDPPARPDRLRTPRRCPAPVPGQWPCPDRSGADRVRVQPAHRDHETYVTAAVVAHPAECDAPDLLDLTHRLPHCVDESDERLPQMCGQALDPIHDLGDIAFELRALPSERPTSTPRGGGLRCVCSSTGWAEPGVSQDIPIACLDVRGVRAGSTVADRGV